MSLRRLACLAAIAVLALPQNSREQCEHMAIWITQGEAAMLLSAVDASEAGFKQNAGKRVLHLATHGFS